MFRLLCILGLVLTGNALAAESADAAKQYRDYFERQALPYAQPKSCASGKECSVVGDFNGDGVQDFAALYAYTGPKSRYGKFSVDLVIVYSQEDSAEPVHAIYKNVARIGDEQYAAASLAVQPVGAMKIPIGEFELEHAGINIVSAMDRSRDQDTTLYWQDGEFRAIDKATD